MPIQRPSSEALYSTGEFEPDTNSSGRNSVRNNTDWTCATDAQTLKFYSQLKN